MPLDLRGPAVSLCVCAWVCCVFVCLCVCVFACVCVFVCVFRGPTKLLSVETTKSQGGTLANDTQIVFGRPAHSV